MRAYIKPKKLCGAADAISSKSAAHRALIAAALSGEKTEILLNVFSQDIEATAGCIAALGADVDRRENGFLVSPPAGFGGSAVLDCRESGSTARFLLPVAGVLGVRAFLRGSGRLPLRPFSPVVAAMRAHGCEISSDRLPIETRGRLKAGRYEIAGDVSSQYITGLLLALPLLGGDSEIVLTSPLQSAGYVGVTLEVMGEFGVSAERTQSGFYVAGGQRYRSRGVFAVEGDWSNGAVLLCAGALGGKVTVRGLRRRSPQGDRAIADVLSRMGAEVAQSDDSVSVSGNGLVGADVDARDIPDLVPAIAAVAATAKGVSRIRGAQRLRLKESDRLKTVSEELNRLGARVRETEDGLVIEGVGSLRGGRMSGRGDHRIVMMGALAACRCEGEVEIDGCESVSKSYPSFFEDYNSLGGDVHVVDAG